LWLPSALYVVRTPHEFGVLTLLWHSLRTAVTAASSARQHIVADPFMLFKQLPHFHPMPHLDT
jgi:hypothetical protein